MYIFKNSFDKLINRQYGLFFGSGSRKTNVKSIQKYQ